MVARENKNNAYAKFGGTNGEYYGIFRSGLLSIILSGVSHEEGLCQSGLAPLEARRAESCVNFLKSVW